MEMKKVDHKNFERKIRVRRLKPEDFDQVVVLAKKCFPGMKPWIERQFLSMLERFPDGQLCVEFNKQIVASSSSLMLDFGKYSQWHDWKLISDGGYISNHDPEGDTLYGLEMMVDPEYRGMRLSRRLYEKRKAFVKKRNIARIVIGGRIPGYKDHAKKMSVEEYVQLVVGKSLTDPTLTSQVSNGFVLRGIIPDYMPSDEDSAGYATFLEWTNPNYVPKTGQNRPAEHNVNVCTVQYQMRGIKNFKEFAQQVEFFVDVASDYRSDFIVFPELITAQLLSCTPAKRPGEAARKIAELTPDYLKLFSKLAIKYNVNVVGGSQFVLEGVNLYNIAYLFGRDGSIGKQYKLHITPSERKWWGISPGDKLEVFDTDRGKVAILICYDIEFPELARLAAAKGAQILFVPFNTDNRQGYLRVRLCAQARCIENHAYVVTSGCVGNLPMSENADIHYAQSGVYTPSDPRFSRDGIAAECTPNIETVVMQNLDLQLLREHRISGATQNWNDRRTDLYTVDFPLEKTKV